MWEKRTDKIIFVPNNEEMNDFFNWLYQNIDSLIINYIWECNDWNLFIEWLENLDCFKQSEIQYYYEFYFAYKNKYLLKTKLAEFLSLRYSQDNEFAFWCFEYFENEITEFFKNN